MAARWFFSRDDDDVDCDGGSDVNTYAALRIASIFIILVTSLFGALTPIVARRQRVLRAFIPEVAFQVAKYFGSGVIIATAFIHLLVPAMEELSSSCLSPAWQDYPYAMAICLISIFLIFIVELVAFRWGTAVLSKVGIAYDAHSHGHCAAAALSPNTPTSEARNPDDLPKLSYDDINETRNPERAVGALEMGSEGELAPKPMSDSVIAQVIGVAILEFGILLHSVFVGLTLAVDEQFIILFIVIIFHQTFEGLGVGSRLADMALPPKYDYVPVVGAILYGLTTPVGIAAGVGVRSAYNPDGPTASIVSGVLDAFSAGILVYTSLVELMAHEFIFNKEMMSGSTRNIVFSLGCMMVGAGLMALLGKWA